MSTPYYDDDETLITLHNGDCLEVMAEMSSDSVDIVVTSPPYNMGLTPGGNGRGTYKHTTQKARRFADGYGQHDDAMAQDDYDAWQRKVLAECWRIARKAVFYNHRPRIEHGVLRDPLGNDFGIPLRQRIIWNRGTGIDVNLRNFCTRGEYIYLFAKPDFQLVTHAASGMGDVWDLGIEYGIKDHPAPFPISLPARCIEATGAQSVLDPFSGSGTTLRAAMDHGIRGIGIELEEKFCAMTVGRLQQQALDLWSAA
ncbi:DNA-methyltransferase [Georgenia thermotolerans]|uniref:DNA-methyltransferase n=1 Tax=Georgenia thermotolerans TaxID=527326 RepID=UPI00186B4876|nr:site-specific DNA-methyltransferase [Georgenia thermotolerans]